MIVAEEIPRIKIGINLARKRRTRRENSSDCCDRSNFSIVVVVVVSCRLVGSLMPWKMAGTRFIHYKVRDIAVKEVKWNNVDKKSGLGNFPIGY